jgi:hypothetical protein
MSKETDESLSFIVFTADFTYAYYHRGIFLRKHIAVAYILQSTECITYTVLQLYFQRNCHTSLSLVKSGMVG